MKTDLIEIFQTIRAALQPYAALGFNNRTNSEEQYDLWSEKNLDIDGQRRTETFFVSVDIKVDHVSLELLPESLAQHEPNIVIRELDDHMISLIEDKVAAGYKIFKEQEWV
jgi:hypothetical protein